MRSDTYLKDSLRFLVLCLFFSAAFLPFVRTAAAQGQFGQSPGWCRPGLVVRIPDAGITVRNELTGVEFKTASNAEWNYIVTSLVPGT